MLKGLALTPPLVGRIAIGKVVIANGKRLPEKDDEFTITTQVQLRDGWMLHPLNEALRKAQGAIATKATATAKPAKDMAKESPAAVKLRAIPVRLLFNDPDLNLRANYSVFDKATGRPLCIGNGETCKRSTPTGVQTLPCATPDGCGLGMKTGCKPYGRLTVRIGDEDELGSFIFRTTGYNSIRTLSARLRYYQALSRDALAALPLELRLRGKSTAQSYRAPIYYVDLTVRSGSTLAQALEAARGEAQARIENGFDQAALDAAARAGFAAGAFEESAEEGVAVVEEFYPDDLDTVAASSLKPSTGKPGLAEKLDRKWTLAEGTGIGAGGK
ncbi:hypothetical protein ACSFA0_23190 [Variovorax sp. LT1P1]|uniref:recombination directionality factor n=1 Tax=Variovorax sp. LT1P1 TaxID=3443730 RepID=UPI003F46843A